MYLVDLREKISAADSLEELLESTCRVWDSLYSRMRQDETLWIIAPNDYRDGELWPCAMAVADSVQEQTELVLRNIISVHTGVETTDTPDLRTSYCEILFFVRDQKNYQFHKDKIRVDHVYEGNEWGERKIGSSGYHDTEVRRYNPEGKDPGNVWLQEDRTHTGGQSVDETGPMSLTEAIRRCILVGTISKEPVQTLWWAGNEEIKVGSRTLVDISEEFQND